MSAHDTAVDMPTCTCHPWNS